MDLRQRKKLRFFLQISLGLHLALFLFMMLGQWIFPSSTELFQPSVQIDMVALPDIVKSSADLNIDTSLPIKDAPPPPPKPEPEPAPAEEEIALPTPEQKDKQAESDAKKALERLRNQKKKEQKAEDKRQQDLLQQREKDLKRFEETYRTAIKGNQLNEGTSMTGAMEATKNAYIGHVQSKLQANWALPVWLQSQGLRAVVVIYLDARGNIIRYQFSQSSGNDAFDNYVKGTLKNSSPFSPPPEEMAKILRNSGLGVKFPL